MNESFYEMYCNTKDLIEAATEELDALDDDALNYIQDLKLSLVIFDEKCPEYKERHDHEY